jgi:SAM-dependent methyltransferase
MRVLNVLAPRFSKRRLFLSILRDFLYRPASILGRLAPLNFRNAKICANLDMHCCVCGQHGKMSYDFPDVRLRKAHGIGVLRETLRCRSCGGSMRDRQMAFGLLRVLSKRTGVAAPDLRTYRERQNANLRILDTDAFGAINRTLRGMPGYKVSQFQPRSPNGSTLPDGSLNVNLESMPFEDNSFDVILTSDVMEHVFNDGLAHQEIHRCLATHGSYTFTVPFDPCIVGHRRLTEPTGREHGCFLLEKHVHGDPHDSSGIVAHRIYGCQLLDDMTALGYAINFEIIHHPEIGIFGGDLFVATKRS